MNLKNAFYSIKNENSLTDLFRSKLKSEFNIDVVLKISIHSGLINPNQVAAHYNNYNFNKVYNGFITVRLKDNADICNKIIEVLVKSNIAFVIEEDNTFDDKWGHFSYQL